MDSTKRSPPHTRSHTNLKRLGCTMPVFSVSQVHTSFLTAPHTHTFILIHTFSFAYRHTHTKLLQSPHMYTQTNIQGDVHRKTRARTHTHLGPLKRTHIRRQKLHHGLERTTVCDYSTAHSKIYRNHTRQKYLGDRKHCSLHQQQWNHNLQS